MTPQEIRNLIGLAEHGKSRDIAKIAKICQEHTDLESQLDLMQSNSQQHSLKSDTDFNALARWQKWALAETRNLRTQISESLEKRKAARMVAAKSAAKVQALEGLLKKALIAEVLTNRRRAEQNGQPPDA